MDSKCRDIEARHHFMKLTMARVLSRVTEPWAQIHYRCGQDTGQLSISCYWQPLSATAVLDIELRARGGDVGWRYIADLGRVTASGDWRVTDIPWVTKEGGVSTDHAMWAALSAVDALTWPELSLSYQWRGTDDWLELPSLAVDL